MIKVGSWVYLSNRLPPHHPGYQSAVEIYRNPGRVVSIEDGRAMVDLGSWGQFGAHVHELRPAEEGW